MTDLVTDAAQHAILEAAMPVSPDDDEVCILPIGNGHERGCGRCLLETGGEGQS